jgi:hypothetical protein
MAHEDGQFVCSPVLVDKFCCFFDSQPRRSTLIKKWYGACALFARHLPRHWPVVCLFCSLQVLAYSVYDEGESSMFDHNVEAFLNLTAAGLDMLVT